MPTTRTDASAPRLVAPEKRPALSAVRRTAVTVATASLAAVALLPLAVPAGASPVVPDGAARSSVSFVLAQTPQQAGELASLARDGRRGRAGFAATVPSRSRHDAVTSWARSHGYAVVHDGPFVVQVTGSADALAADLGTSLSRTGALHATSAPQVPAALAGTVASVVGLDERPAFRHQVAYSPTQLQTMSGLVSSVLDPTAGLGTTVGTVNLGPWYAGDLTTFAAAKGLTVAPGQVTPVSVDGSSTVADPATDDGSSAEVALDVEAVLATAPAAKQRQYFSANTFAGYVAILDAMTADAANGLLHTASSSWGLCEQYESSSTLSSQSAAVQRLVAAGATFFASSGDDGANDCGDSSLAVDYPASDPYTVGVGGVHATTGTSGWAFSAWGSSTPLVTGAGG
ncbi:MAG: protease pro-enzyme activation domain-containing protein, partial [Mycobacteriales bacterium]